MRFIVKEEKISGTRQKSYAVVDTSIDHVVVRLADQEIANELASKANERSEAGE